MKIFSVLNRYFDNFITRKFVTPYIRFRTGDKVASGPFKGMNYISGSVGSRLTPKFLGTYELELAPTIEKICKKNFDVIVDVGAAEGYYAVGMAMRNQKTKVIAFESEDTGRELIGEMAVKNRVAKRVDIRGHCGIGSLSDAISENKKCLVMMDIEGAEMELLDNDVVPKLNRCHILVEAHECVVPGVSDTIKNRFKNTHKINEIDERSRGMSDFPLAVPFIFRTLLKRYFIYNSMDEARFDSLVGRPEKNAGWLYLEPKHMQ